jgi:hypothetical protein
MDDVYCPVCMLVLQRRGSGQFTPRHCPRCLARARRLVELLALDQFDAAANGSEREAS